MTVHTCAALCLPEALYPVAQYLVIGKPLCQCQPSTDLATYLRQRYRHEWFSGCYMIIRWRNSVQAPACVPQLVHSCMSAIDQEQLGSLCPVAAD